MAMSNEFPNKGNNQKSGSKSLFAKIFPTKGDDTKTVAFKMIFIVAAIALIVSLIFLISYFMDSNRNKQTIDDVRSTFSMAIDESSNSSSSDSTSSDDASSDESSDTDSSTEDSSSTESATTDGTTSSGGAVTPTQGNVQAGIAELKKKNSHTVAWIEIKGTEVKYPVLQTNNNDFYMDHDFDKKSSKAGWIFADFRVPVASSNNAVLYGHNMANGTFFRQLHDYKKLSFIKAHPIVDFNNLQENNQYKIFGVILTNAYAKDDGGVVFDYHNKVFQYTNQSTFDTFYNEIMKRSYYNTPVDVKFGDQILVLQTCGNSSDFKDSRVVVFARKVRPGESATVDTSKIVENTDKYMSLAWYKVQGIKAPR